MQNTNSLLIEIGTEELPPLSLATLSEAFKAGLCAAFKQEAMTYGQVKSFASPRRLALLFSAVAAKQEDLEKVRRGPFVSQALKDGEASPALKGFAQSCGVVISELQIEESDKGPLYVHRAKISGATLESLLARLLPEVLKTLPIAKKMRWGSNTYSFIRPVQWFVALHGNKILNLEIFGLKAGQLSHGHRVHHPEPIILHNAQDYGSQLKQGHVLASITEREKLILEQVQELAAPLQATPVLPKALLKELVALVEWPKAYLISFEPAFLALPKEVLITVMQQHQRYIALEAKNTQLLNYCIVIANQDFADPTSLIKGNERVLRARFEDARFFYQQDLNESLWARKDSLDQLLFQEKLGSLADKTKRLVPLVQALGSSFNLEPALCERTALLAKSDLRTQMVSEFPELQGIMGRTYALAYHEDPKLATALYEQYLPKGANQALPQSPLGICLALADRLDSLVGLFGIGLAPTGSKDPFALRRAMLAVLSILFESTIDFDLRELLDLTQKGYGSIIAPQTTELVLSFAYDRLYAYFGDQGVPSTVVDAVLSLKPSQALDLAKRISALMLFKERPEALILAAANKRIHNLLTKNNGASSQTVQPELLIEAAEQKLYACLIKLKAQNEPLYETQSYGQLLENLLVLEQALETFFTEVMVMVEDLKLRRNRLSLLAALQHQCSLVGDLSCLA